MPAHVIFVQVWLFSLAKLRLVPNLRKWGKSGQKLILFFSWSWACNKCCFSRWCHLRPDLSCTTCGPPACTLLWYSVLPCDSCVFILGVKRPHGVLGRAQLQLWERQVSVSLTTKVQPVLCSGGILGGEGSWHLLSAWGRQEVGCLEKGRLQPLSSVMKQGLLWGLELYFPSYLLLFFSMAHILVKFKCFKVI